MNRTEKTNKTEPEELALTGLFPRAHFWEAVF